MGEPHEAARAALPREESPAVILTPDQRVRVFISSTLGELAAERAAARRAITRLHPTPSPGLTAVIAGHPHGDQLSLRRTLADSARMGAGRWGVS